MVGQGVKPCPIIALPLLILFTQAPNYNNKTPCTERVQGVVVCRGRNMPTPQ